MKELKTISELEIMYCLFYLLRKRIYYEELINDDVVKRCTCQDKLTNLNKQLEEVRYRIEELLS